MNGMGTYIEHLFSTFMANILQSAILCSVLLGISGETCSQDDSWGAPWTDQVLPDDIDTWCHLQCSIQYQQYGIQRIDNTPDSKARCYCGNNTGSACRSTCIFICGADRQPCGGPTCMTVYPVTDRNYCYKDTQWGSHHNEEIDDGNYNQVCESICRTNNTIYYGLQGTEIPGPVKCYCGNELHQDNKCMSQCSSQCSGSIPCGSGSCMSVYAVSPSSPMTTSTASSTTVTTPITTTTVTTTTASKPTTTTETTTPPTTETTTPTTNIASSDETSTGDPDGLSRRATAGISVGVVIFVALVIFLSIFLTRRRKNPALLQDVYVNQGFADLTETAKPPDQNCSDEADGNFSVNTAAALTDKVENPRISSLNKEGDYLVPLQIMDNQFNLTNPADDSRGSLQDNPENNPHILNSNYENYISENSDHVKYMNIKETPSQNEKRLNLKPMNSTGSSKSNRKDSFWPPDDHEPEKQIYYNDVDGEIKEHDQNKIRICLGDYTEITEIDIGSGYESLSHKHANMPNYEVIDNQN